MLKKSDVLHNFIISIITMSKKLQFQYQINLQLSLIAVLLTIEFIPKLPIFIVIIFYCPLQNAML